MMENELPTPLLPEGVYVFFQLFDVRLHCSSISAGSCAGYSYASKAFIFSLYNVKGYNPVKLTQYQNQQYAMYRCNTYGPTFGNHDIYISDGSGNNQNSYTRCGYTYTTPSGYSTGNCGFFTGGSHFSPKDVEVFYEAGNQENHPFLKINTQQGLQQNQIVYCRNILRKLCCLSTDSLLFCHFEAY